MKKLLILVPCLLFSISAFAADDASNKAKFEKDCAAMIAPGGPCADVKAGGGGRRSCVSKPENIEKASPECKAVIEEWKTLQQK
ncbi:MAG TPA: hypothetical protein VK452_02255 [Dissulfurispiraceae bacterium]|nr:hypothetical protein [Dissulfurispiraceae bacterium]